MIKKMCRYLKFIIVILVVFMAGLLGVLFSVYNEEISEETINYKTEELRNNKDYVKINDIDETFLNAIVAVEDHRFYNHGAIDLISIARASYENIKSGQIIQGGSTITQQLAKNLFLSNEKTFKRKIKETIIAFELESKYSKNEILELYVNIIYYGDGYTGILEASNGYFNKKPSELNEDEATLLAGIPQAPSYYALSNNYAQAKERQKEVVEAINSYKETIELNLGY